MQPTITMMVGLAASGKSTYAKKLANDTDAIILSSDAIRWELFGDETDQEHNQQVFQELHKRAKQWLKSGRSMVYDSTNINSKRRRAFLNELKKIDCTKECIIMATPYEQCLENNRNRERKVPEWVIERMYRKWQTPHTFEGFNKVDIKYWDDEHFVEETDIVNSLLDFDQQNPHHSLTLGEHLLKTWQTCHLNDFNLIDSLDVLSACLVHDCGKPFVKTFTNAKGEATNIAHYYDHEHVSAYESLFIQQGVLKEGWDYIAPNIVNVSALVTWHMQPYFFGYNNNEKLRNKYKRIWDEKFYSQIMCLHEADKMAH